MFVFHSKLHPHLSMNSSGVVFASNGHPDGVGYFGSNSEYVPLRVGLGSLQKAVWREARQSGLRMQRRRKDGAVFFSRPRIEVPTIGA